MTYSLAAATVHGGGFPAPLTVLVVVAAVAYVLWSRMKGQPLKVRRLLVLPVVLTVIGITDLTGSSAPHLNPADIAFLVVSVAISAVLGAARGATIELYPNQGELWQRYRRSTVGLWVALIATKLIIAVIASAAGASAGGGTNSLLLTLGVSLLAEAAIVAPRALSTGVPFASGTKTSGHDQPNHDLGSPTQARPGQPGPTMSRSNRPSSALSSSGWAGAAQPRRSVTDRSVDVAPPQEPPTAYRLGTVVDEPVWPRPDDEQTAWRSPSLSEGTSWLRRQLEQAGRKDLGQEATSPGPADDDRDERHHHHHHGLTGRS
jgi:hypothetical protein